MTSRSGASGCTMLQPPTDGGELRRNRKHIIMCPVDISPAACEQPNTIGTGRQASCNEQPAATADPCARPRPLCNLHLQDNHHPQNTVFALVEQCTLQQDSQSSCSTSKSLGVNQYCAEYVCVVKAYFHFILVIVLCTCVHMQKHW